MLGPNFLLQILILDRNFIDFIDLEAGQAVLYKAKLQLASKLAPAAELPRLLHRRVPCTSPHQRREVADRQRPDVAERAGRLLTWC